MTKRSWSSNEFIVEPSSSMEPSKYLNRHSLYDSYCFELSRYDSAIYRHSKEVSGWCDDYLNDISGRIYWIPITTAVVTSEIGFVIISKLFPREAEESGIDYFIEQVYIKPEFRGQKHVLNTLNTFTAEHKGRYGMYVLKKNEKAKDFWCKFMDNIKAEKIALDTEKEPFKSHMTSEDELWGFEL